MGWRSESTLLRLIHQRDEQIAALAKQSVEKTSVEFDEIILSATVELEDLRNELEFVRKEGPGSDDEPDSFVPAPLKPLPSLHSAGIALPEPFDS